MAPSSWHASSIWHKPGMYPYPTEGSLRAVGYTGVRPARYRGPRTSYPNPNALGLNCWGVEGTRLERFAACFLQSMLSSRFRFAGAGLSGYCSRYMAAHGEGFGASICLILVSSE